MGAPYIYIWH